MNRYKINGELGDGSFGRVMKATQKDTGEVVAIKYIKRKYKTWRACMDLREVQSLRNMSQHRNIVTIKEVIRERDDSLYFVLEYMSGGSLYELTKGCLEDRNAGRPEQMTREMIKSFVKQILSALAYIHKNNYVHRDIKPENILVSGSRSTVKLCDFGLAREVSNNGRGNITFYVSTRWYRAPEVILHCPSYGKPIDLFATGLILAELYSLRPLFPGISEIDQLAKMMRVLGPPTEWAEGTRRMSKLNFQLVDPAPGATAEELENQTELAIMKTLPREAESKVAHLIRILIDWNPSARPSAESSLKDEYFQSKISTGNGVQPATKQEPESTNERGNKKGSTGDSVGDELKVQRRQIVGSQTNSKTPAGSHNKPQVQEEEPNEFSQYINAFHESELAASSAAAVVTRQPGDNHRLYGGNRIRSMFSGIEHDDEQKSKPNYQRDPTPSARRNRILGNINASMPPANKEYGMLAGKSVKKTMNCRNRTTNQPRWLPNNMGRRALATELISRPTERESFIIPDHQQQGKNRGFSRSGGSINPFNLLE